jgi:hypothetical protein
LGIASSLTAAKVFIIQCPSPNQAQQTTAHEPRWISGHDKGLKQQHSSFNIQHGNFEMSRSENQPC